jgi:hypothetical protein
VTTAKPGEMHIFDISKGVGEPKLVKSLATAEGAHHIAFTKDGRYAYVQNALLNRGPRPERRFGLLTFQLLEPLRLRRVLRLVR